MTITPDKPRTGRAASFVILIFLAIGALTVIWWYRPGNSEKRYESMSRVALEQVLEREQNNKVAWKVFALRMAQDGAAGSAEPALIKAHQLNPADAALATGLGELWMSQGRIPEAFQVLKQAALAHPNSVAPHRALGRLYMKRASYQHAMDELALVVKLDPKADDAWYSMAISSLQMQKAADANSQIEKALSLSQGNPQYMAVHGSILVALGRVDEGITTRIEAAKRAPKDIKIQSGLVNLLLEQHRSDADTTTAEEAIARIEQVSTDYPLLPYQRGKVEMLRGHWDAAERYLRKAIESSPQQDEIYFALGQTERHLGNAAASAQMMKMYENRTAIHRKIDQARASLADNPKDVTAYMKMADSYMILGDRVSAISAIKSGLEIEPAHAVLKRWLQTLDTPQPVRQ